MQPSIWARIESGLTTGPQSIAQTTRWTRTFPPSDRGLGDVGDEAPERLMDGDPTSPSLSAVGAPSLIFRRRDRAHACAAGVWSRAHGGTRKVFPAAWAISSIKLSTANAVCVWPTSAARSPAPPPVQFTGDLEIRDLIGQVGSRLDRRLVNTILNQHLFERRTHRERLTDDPVLPGDRGAIGGEGGGDRMNAIGR